MSDMDIVTPKRIAIPKIPIGGTISVSAACGYDRDVDLLCKDYGLRMIRPSCDGGVVVYFNNGTQERIDNSEPDRIELAFQMFEEQMGFNRVHSKGTIRS
jgi:hypothetical protein